MRLEVRIHNKATGEEVGVVAVAVSENITEGAKIRQIKRVLGWTHKYCAIYRDSGVTELHPKGEEEAAVF